jgi:trimethylamine--corrinoid protein Co-methyltransferase
MTTPKLRLLSTEEVKAIHQSALRTLAETGMVVDHEHALELLDGAGCRVEAGSHRVRFPAAVVERCLALVPRTYSYLGRDPDVDVTLSVNGPVYARHAGGATGYVDLESGLQRRATLADWQQFATLLDALPNVNAITTLHVGDVPTATADLHSLRVALSAQRKCVISNAFTASNMHAILDMLWAVAGSPEAFRARPFVHHMMSPISPLYLPEDDVEQLLLCCEHGVPTDIPIMPICGATAPITLAGTLVQSLAEYLGTVVLAQTAEPGHAMPFFVDPVVGDMRTGDAVFAAPEVALLVAGIAQVGRELYGLPPQAIGLDSDGFDRAQTLFQKAQMTIFEVLAGGRFLIGAGTVESCMSLDPVQLVIDDEIVAYARRWDEGLAVDEGRLAVAALAAVGPRGEFLSADHTLDYVRSGELLTPELFSRGGRESWQAMGGLSVEERARAKARRILATHEVAPLADEVLRELDAVIARLESAAVA